MSISPLPHANQAKLAASRLPLTVGAGFSFAEIEAYNNSVDFKLRSAEYYLQSLEDELKEVSARTFARAGGPRLFLVNLFLDGFLTAAVSASDVLGKELNLYYGRPLTQSRFYVHDVVNALRDRGRGNRIVAHLGPALDPAIVPKPLIPLLKTYRNCSMHTRLIDTATVLSGTVTYAAQQTGAAVNLKPSCHLPDDPDIYPCTYLQGIEVLTFCGKALQDLAQLLDHSYDILQAEMARAASLPM